MIAVAAPGDELAARRRRAVVAALALDLPRRGAAVHPAQDWPGTLEQWHQAAAEVAELLRRPVRAGAAGRVTLWMVVTDWPRTTAELTRAAAQLALGAPPG